MYRKTLFGIFLMTFLVTGCSGYFQNIEEVNSDVEEFVNSKVDVYVPKVLQLNEYEPEEGIYLGAYAEKNINLDNDITQLEEILDKKQTFRVFQYTKQGDISPINILECIANEQTPYIKILLDDKFSLNKLYTLIGDIGNTYNEPVFIELFPVTQEIVDPIEYKRAYEEAHEIITRYIEDAVIVWSVDIEKTYELASYYPGDELVDWVGVNIYLPQYKGGELYQPTLMQNIDFWYTHFQEDKPMFISSVAISHYSRYDYTYRMQDAKNKFSIIYEDITRIYPRIKGIMYIDVDMNEVTGQGKEDYRISYEPEIVSYFSSLVQSDNYLERLEKSDIGEVSQYIKYSVPIVEVADEPYVTQVYMDTLFKEVKTNRVSAIQDIEGEIYYKLDDIMQELDGYYFK